MCNEVELAMDVGDHGRLLDVHDLGRETWNLNFRISPLQSVHAAIFQYHGTMYSGRTLSVADRAAVYRSHAVD